MKLIVIAAILILDSAVANRATEGEIEACRNLAMRRMCGAVLPGESLYYADKVTLFLKNTDRYPEVSNMNVCSSFSFFEDLKCDTIKIIRDIKKDRKLVVVTATESKLFNNVAVYNEEFNLMNPQSCVYQAQVTKMELYDSNGSQSVNIPSTVNVAHGQLYAMVDRDIQHERWAIYATCQQRHIYWALINDEAYNNEDVRKICLCRNRPENQETGK